MKPNRKPVFVCEAETTIGLESITVSELREFGAEITETRPGEVDFRFAGELAHLLELKTVQSVSLVQSFNVPRPRGLLDNTNIRLIVQKIDLIRKLSPAAAYQTYFIAAAGSDSAIMNRIKVTLAEHTGLMNSNEKGDLWIRIRPNRAGGWETVIRLSPRPLVTRPWRLCNLEGALNAATAHALVMLTEPKPEDSFVNLACGSGTLLIERLAFGTCQQAVGIDFAIDHLRCAQENIRASHQEQHIALQLADIAHLALRTASVTALCADLPFGQLTGSHGANQQLYPAVLREAARIAVTGANFVLLTHEIRLMDSILPLHPQWSLEQTLRVNLRGLHPRIYVLQRQ